MYAEEYLIRCWSDQECSVRAVGLLLPGCGVGKTMISGSRSGWVAMTSFNLVEFIGKEAALHK